MDDGMFVVSTQDSFNFLKHS